MSYVLEYLHMNKKIKQNNNFLELIKFVILSVAIVVPIRVFIAQPFVVSGDSMIPNFQNKDYLIIDEISFILGEPKRGDVIVFRYPNDTKKFFIKRIIGMPNETIVIENGRTTIINEENPDGLLLDESYINESFNTTSVYKTRDEEYFVMGDNRNKSSDSRYWGVLPRKLIVGRAYLRLLPINNISHLPGNINHNDK